MGSMNYILVGYIILNLVKNDTVNYFPSFITYSFLLFIAINSKSFLEDLLDIKINNEKMFVNKSIVFKGLNLGILL